MDTLNFDDSFLREMPGDQSLRGETRQTPKVLYSRVHPTPVSDPKILLWNEELSGQLGFSNPGIADHWQAEVFSGNRLMPGMVPFASRYGGHQFGHWAGQLGDGRAMTLGELKTANGERWELQLKGAGPTPYSRRADGRAVLRSSLREYLCSESMHKLGVPTTRALSLVSTGDKVLRDMFYDGHPAYEEGAIVTRAASSFLRFGSFEILAASGEIDLLRDLADYTLRNFYPEFLPNPEGYAAWFQEICRRTALMIVDWMRVGFVHGVMNTDNMSILGLTIDYGPYGWLDTFDPEFTPNTTDAQNKRYRYSQQPAIGLWNLARLAEALAPLIRSEELLESGLEVYRQTFGEGYRCMLANKLGLDSLRDESDQALSHDLDSLLRSTEIDGTLFYRALADAQGTEEGRGVSQLLRDSFYSPNPAVESALASWLLRYQVRCAAEPLPNGERARRMNLYNPYVIPRNYLVQEVLDALAKGESDPLRALTKALLTPYQENEFTRPFHRKRPEWARSRPGCSDLSCSS